MINRPNAILVLNPNNGDQGFLLPQLTSSQRLNIAPTSPDEDGLVVFDITDKSFYYWSNNAWSKGLGGGNNQTISYDAATQTISLSGGNSVVLSALKELPVQTGQAGKYLTTDGSTVSWVTAAALGDITEVVAGPGLTGGSISGIATLSVNVNPTSLTINGSNQVELANDAVTTSKLGNSSVTDAKVVSIAPSKLLAGGATTGQILKWNGSNWVPQADNAGTGTVTQIIAGTGLSGGTITATGTIELTNTGVTPSSYGSGTQIPILAIDAQGRITNASSVAVSGAVPTGAAGGDLTGTYPNPAIANNAITTNKLSVDAVTSAKIADGTIQSTDIANDAITSLKIADGTIATLDLQANSITDAKIASGISLSKLSGSSASTGQVLKWNGSGWAPDNENAAITSITATGGLEGGTITSTGSISIADNGVTSAKILDATIVTTDIADNAVTSNKLTATGVVASTYGSATQVPVIQVDAKGRISTVTNTTISGILPSGAAGGDLTGTYPNPTVANNAIGSSEIIDGTISGTDLADAAVTNIKLADASVNSLKIQDASIQTADLANGSITTVKVAAGTNNTILTTNSSGTVTWVNQIPTSALSSSGATAGNLLVFNGTNWIPENATVDGTTIAGAGIPANPFRVKEGTANQVLITNASNTVAWINQSSLASNLSASGDVTGTLNATTVRKIQGVTVEPTAPADDQVLQYDQATSQWRPTTLTGVGSTVIAFKAQQLLGQIIVANVLTQLAWATELYDESNNFIASAVPGTAAFTAPSAGIYHFDVLVTIDNADNGDEYQLRLREGTISFTDLQRVYSISGQNGTYSLSLSTDVKLNANDRISVWVQLESSETLIPGISTQFSGRKVN